MIFCVRSLMKMEFRCINKFVACADAAFAPVVLTLETSLVFMMKIIIVLVAVLASVSSQGYRPEEEQYAPNPYSFNYVAESDDGGTSSHQETGDGTGSVSGSYSVTDLDGIGRTVDYVADAGGFRANVRTNEPGTESAEPADVVIESTAEGAQGPVLRFGSNQYNQPQYGQPQSYSRPQYRQPQSYSRPQYGQPQSYSRPQYSQPQSYNRQQYGQPQSYSRPQYRQPQSYSRPQYGQPQGYNRQQYGQPQSYNSPQYGRSQYGQPQSYNRPQYGQPQYYNAPQYGQPQY